MQLQHSRIEKRCEPHPSVCFSKSHTQRGVGAQHTGNSSSLHSARRKTNVPTVEICHAKKCQAVLSPTQDVRRGQQLSCERENYALRLGLQHGRVGTARGRETVAPDMPVIAVKLRPPELRLESPCLRNSSSPSQGFRRSTKNGRPENRRPSSGNQSRAQVITVGGPQKRPSCTLECIGCIHGAPPPRVGRLAHRGPSCDKRITAGTPCLPRSSVGEGDQD